MPFTQAQLKEIVNQYHTMGYVVVPGLIPPSLYPRLCLAADTITAQARAREWTQVRMVGKQFPPWDEGDDVWGVQNIMHPGLEQPVFAEWYGSEDLLNVSAALMGCEVKDMQFELFNLLVNPLHKDYRLSWHRDAIKATVSEAEEAIGLGVKHYGIQWNAALYDDECLRAVPGSHNRVRTFEERQASLDRGEMPGALTLRIKRGETVFYNNNILHVGKYNPAVKRRTLHGSYGCPNEGDPSRARGILQHDIEYTSDPTFKESLPKSLHPLIERLNRYQEMLQGEEINYAQEL